jgi:hypothetical protein
VATFVDTTLKQIDAHLSELTTEVSRLEAARHALVGNGASPAPTTRRRRGRPRKTTTVTAAAPESPATTSPTPRRRGRPPKTTTAAAAPTSTVATPASVPRRKPGRPRKTTAAAAPAPASATPTSTTPRRVGRPPKTAPAVAPAPSSAATKSRPAARKPGRPRGRRSAGGRATEALALVKAQPGVTIPQLAAAMKIQPNYLYRVLPKLAANGQLKRDGKGWHPAS